MTKTTTKKRSNKKPAAVVAAAAKKRLSLGNSSTDKPRKRARKNVSHQQTIQVRDTLDAEYRDWRTGVSKRILLSSLSFLPFSPTAIILRLSVSDIDFSSSRVPSPWCRSQTISTMQDLHPVDGPTTPMAVPAVGLGSSEQSVQDLAGILSAL